MAGVERKGAALRLSAKPARAATMSDNAFNDEGSRLIAHGRNSMQQIGRDIALGLIALTTAGIAVVGDEPG
jgi:hypothetical protein